MVLSATPTAVVEPCGKRGNEIARAPAAEDVRRPVAIEIEAADADQRRQADRGGEGGRAANESFAPKDVRECAAQGCRCGGMRRGKGECAFGHPADPRRPCAGVDTLCA